MSVPVRPPQRDRIGVIGAGTMGSGIALAALFAGLKVVLYDIQQSMLEDAQAYIRQHLERKQRAISFQYLTLTDDLQHMARCGTVIEAAPEVLEIKQDLFERLDAICPPPAVLATNTSTLPVTAIAAATQTPERVVGMHFFNPAPVLPLVEVIQGAATSPQTMAAVVDLAKRMEKTPVVARDTPGFIVNRVARPFYGEALRLAGERAAPYEVIDHVVRLGGGFRMGPFELMDLIGIDINFAATQSVYEQTFGEPRYRPHLIQAQMVQQKALGRKTGRGFYHYRDGKPVNINPPGPTHPALPQVDGTLVITPGSWAPGLEESARQSGFCIEGECRLEAPPLAVLVTAGRSEGLEKIVRLFDQELSAHVPLLCQTADVTAAEIAAWTRRPERVVGYDGLFGGSGKLMTLAAGPAFAEDLRPGVEGLVTTLGKQPVWMEDSPALILPRIISMLVNEAAFAAGEGVADPETIDVAMQLGTNYPKGPLAWGREIGYGRLVNVLDHLRAEYGEERYRSAQLLRKWSRQI